MARKIALEIICFLFILLFVYAAVSKILTYDDFAAQIGNSPLFLEVSGLNYSLAILIPMLEAGTAVLLMIPAWKKAALWSGLMLMVLFSLYVFAILNFAPYIPCSCGGALEVMGWESHLAFNLIFVLLAIIGILLHGTETLQQVGGAEHM